MKMGKLILGIFFSVLLLISCKNSNPTSGEIKGTITISGAFAMYPIAVKWGEEFKKLHPGVVINISAGGAGKGMTDALSGMVDLGMVSRPISSTEVQKGAWFVSVTKDAVLPTINSNNPVVNILKEKGIKKEQLCQLFLNDNTITWGELTGTNCSEKAMVYTRSDACGAAEMWGKYLGKSQENLVGTGVFGDPGIADAIKASHNAVGYNNLTYVFDIRTHQPFEGMTVLPIDLNGNGKLDVDENFYTSLDSVVAAVASGKYPSPPARDLYFVSKGKPTQPQVIEFLKWILTDGQKYVGEAGYISLSKSQIDSQLLTLPSSK